MDKGTALYGCRPVVMIHDEIGVEAPEHKAHAAAIRLKQIMKEEMEKWTPDIPAETDAAICRRWRKKAKAVFNDDNEMIPFEDRRLSKKDVALLNILLTGQGAFDEYNKLKLLAEPEQRAEAQRLLARPGCNDDWEVGLHCGLEMGRVAELRLSCASCA